MVLIVSFPWFHPFFYIAYILHNVHYHTFHIVMSDHKSLLSYLAVS